jgi:alginate O-acetyltransferase complex protein AlgF
MSSFSSQRLQRVIAQALLIARSRRRLAQAFAALGFIATALVVAIAPAAAQNRGGLYDPEPPPDSAYVRVVVVGSDRVADLFVDDKPRHQKLSSGEVSDYMILPQGKHTIAVRGAGKAPAGVSYLLDVQKGKALTVAFSGLTSGSTPTIFEDKTNTNKLKAILSVYNLDSRAGNLDVVTGDGNTKVFTNLAYGSSNAILVNPISVDLIATRSGGGASVLPGAANLSMTQGGAYSVFFVPDAKGSLIARPLQNRTERFVAK